MSSLPRWLTREWVANISLAVIVLQTVIWTAGDSLPEWVRIVLATIVAVGGVVTARAGVTPVVASATPEVDESVIPDELMVHRPPDRDR